jgi:hypothetical protein
VVSSDPQRLREIDEYWVHGRHPSGRLLAAEVIGVLANECGVWDLETGDLVWRPKARSISWSEDGSAVGLLVGTDGEAFELRSWPERELIGECRVRPWACCNTYVALSPLADRAAVLWWHQSEGGVNLVEIEDGAARHLQDRGYTTRETNLVQGPAFSSDGRLVAISEGRMWWWLPAENESAEGKPSPGGRFLRGRVIVVDFDSGSVREVEVFGEVDEGWIPPHDGWEHFELLGKPRFVSDHEVLVTPEFGSPIRCELTH